MKRKLSLQIILIISIAGLLFSGYLSYGELFRGSCPIDGGCQYLLSLPTCVYGFFMYLIIFIVSLLGLKSIK